VLGRTTKIFRTTGWMDEILVDDIYNCQNGCKELVRVLIIAHELKSHSSNMK
jgi:hypothetical protein